MRKANTNIERKPKSFASRVKQVETHVAKNIKGMRINQRYATKGRLWCGWLRKEVLS